MRRMVTIAVMGWLIGGAVQAADSSFEQFWADAQKAKRADKSEASQRRLDWWREARFGMFIHWNMCSLMGTEISFSRESFDGGLGGLGVSKGSNPRPELHKGSEFDGLLDWMAPSVPKAVYVARHRDWTYRRI